MMPCPDMPTLRSLLDERLSPGRREEVELHVETCILCEQTLEEMTREDSPWFALLKQDPGWGSVGTSAERFRLVRRIDGGGQGDIYIARDEELQRDVAVKRIKDRYSDDWSRKALLIREALITGSLDHPGIVPVYALGQDNEGHSYYAMRLVRSIVDGGEGRNTLEQAIADFHAGLTRWNLRGLLERFLAVCHTIQYAHDQGVLHCDLKPLNIVLGPYGETLVLDWGAARSVADTQRAPGELRIHADIGCPCTQESDGPTWTGPRFVTVSYASPEQLDCRLGEISRASDVYSLGGILRCILTGYSPRKAAESTTTEEPGGWQAILRRRRTERKFPEALAAVCRKALSERPEDRYASARALADDVGRWLTDEPVSAHREGLIDRMARLCRRNRAWATAGASTLLLVTLVSLACAWWVNLERVGALELSADLARDRGNLLCERGDVSEGALWLARSLEISERDTDDARRVSLAAWSRRLCTLTDYYPLPAGLKPLRIVASGTLVVAETEAGGAQLWNVAERRPLSTNLPGSKHARWLYGRDARFILISKEDHTGRVWDATSGQAIGLPIDHREDVLVAAFSSDGSILLTGHDDGTARAWDVRSGNPLGSVRHPKAVRAVALANHGRTALSSTEDGEVWMWSAGTGDRIGSPIRHGRNRPILAIAFSPDARTVMTSGVKDVVRFWKASTGEPIPGDHDKFAPIHILRLSEDCRFALVALEDATIRVLDVSSGKPVGSSIRHPGLPLIARLSPDGRKVLSRGDDMTVRLWRVESGEPAAAPMVHEANVYALGFAADGRNVVTGSIDGMLRVWQPPDEGAGPALRPTGVVVDITKARPGVPLPLPLKTTSPEPDWIRSVSFDVLGRVVLTATIGGRVQLWDAATGQPLGIPIQDVPPLLAAGLSPDGMRALTTAGDCTVKLWDMNTGHRLQVLPHEGQPLAVSFLPSIDGHSAVTGGEDRKARIWNLVTGELRTPPLDHDAAVNAVASTPDGRTVLTGSEDGSVRRWDARTGRLIGDPLRLARSARTMDFSPDGRVVLISGTDAIGRMFELQGGKPIGRLLPHRGTIRDAAFSRDGRIVLTASDNGLIQAWEVVTGKPLGSSAVQEGGICSLALGIDGRTIVTGSKAGLGRLWRIAGPVEGDPDLLRRKIEIATGLELDRNGATEVLRPGDWEERRARLRELEGQTEAR